MPVRNTPPGTAFLVGDGLKYRAPCLPTYTRENDGTRLSGEKERKPAGRPGRKREGNGQSDRFDGEGTIEWSSRGAGGQGGRESGERERRRGIIFHPSDPSSVREKLDQECAFATRLSRWGHRKLRFKRSLGFVKRDAALRRVPSKLLLDCCWSRSA